MTTLKKIHWRRRIRDAAAVILGRRIAVDAEFAALMLEAATREMNLLIGLGDRPPAALPLSRGDEWHLEPEGVVTLYRFGHPCRSILIVGEVRSSNAAQASPTLPTDDGPDQAHRGPATPRWRD